MANKKNKTANSAVPKTEENVEQSAKKVELSKKELKEQLKQEKEKSKKLAKEKKAKKEKKPGLFKKLKEAWSELKKVTWPTFANVVKKTCVVILVVLIFTVVLFGFDYVLGLLYNMSMS